MTTDFLAGFAVGVVVMALAAIFAIISVARAASRRGFQAGRTAGGGR